MKSLIIIFISFTSLCFSDIKSTNGAIKFDTEADDQAEMVLNETGLGIGITPTANLHVNGNAIVSEQLFVGGSSGSSNLNINGSMGFGFQSITSSTNLSENSYILANSGSDNLILSLPEATSVDGRIYSIKKTSPLNKVSIRDGGYIDNYTDVSLSVNNMGSLSIVSSGGNWHILSLSGNGSAVTSENLIGWWKLDEINGADTANSISGGNVGTITGAIQVSGRIQNALSFDGVDDFLALVDPISGNPTTNSFTICYWIYWVNNVAFRDSRSGGGTLFPWNNGGTIYFRSGGAEAASTATANDYQDRWVFFALTNDKTTSTLYADGEVIGTLVSGSQDFEGPWVAAKNGSVAVYAECLMDDIRFYDRSLTAAEVQAIYDQAR